MTERLAHQDARTDGIDCIDRIDREDPRFDDPDVAEFLGGVDVMRDGAVRAAKALVAIEKKRKHVRFRASSIGQFGELLGCLTAFEARTLLDLGIGIEKSATLRREVDEGMAIGRAALYGEIAKNAPLLLHPPDLKDGEQPPSREDAMKRWIETTRGRTHQQARAVVEQVKAQLRKGPDPVKPFTLFKSDAERRAFEKARDVGVGAHRVRPSVSLDSRADAVRPYGTTSPTPTAGAKRGATCVGSAPITTRCATAGTS